MIGRLNTRGGRAIQTQGVPSVTATGAAAPEHHPALHSHLRAPASCPEWASLQGFALMLGGSVKAQHVMPDPRAAF